MRSLLACWLSLAAALCVTGCVFDGELKHDTGTVPEQLDDGWEVATPESVGLSSETLGAIHRALLREDRYRGALSFLVVKDGKLVFETYLRRRGDRDQFRHIQSATKSVTSLLFGIAMDRGLVGSLDRTVADVFADEAEGLDPAKQAITLRQLLTMTSGIGFDNEDFSVEMWIEKPDRPVRYMLNKPVVAAPGERFYYRDMDPQLVGYALTRLTGQSERAFADETLFAALDIHDYYWEAGPDGVSMAAHGLHLLPRDLAKLGQLVLNRGAWHGQQIVSEGWIDVSTQRQVDSDVPWGDGKLGYGYYWWVVPELGIAMWGHGGQFVLVVPDRELVLVQTAFPDTDLPDSKLHDFLELVAPLLEP